MLGIAGFVAAEIVTEALLAKVALGLKGGVASAGTLRKIKNLRRGSRPNPSTYLSPSYIANHLDQFDYGVTKIISGIDTRFDNMGPPGGTFVMPKSVADDAIRLADGNVRELERLLGLDDGILGESPVRIDIDDPVGLRMPDGNEYGANRQWIPGGVTSGGIPEATIDPVPVINLNPIDIL